MPYVRPAKATSAEWVLAYQGAPNTDPSTIVGIPLTGRFGLLATYYRPTVGEVGYVDSGIPAEFGNLDVDGVAAAGARAFLYAGESGAVQFACTRDAAEAQTVTGLIAWHYPYGSFVAASNRYVYPSGFVNLKLGFGLTEIFEFVPATGGGPDVPPPDVTTPNPCLPLFRPPYPYALPGSMVAGQAPAGVVPRRRPKTGAIANGVTITGGGGAATS